MAFVTALQNHKFILMEAAIIENLQRSKTVKLHPELINSLLIYENTGRAELIAFLDDYISVATRAEVPILICTPTWRANRERLNKAGIARNVNDDAVAFLKAVRDRWQSQGAPILIGGLMGCRNDSYRPEQALTASEAEAFHSWQAERLAAAAPDFLMAATIPSVNEAKGMAQAMGKTGLPYVISFVINRQGRVLDGGSLAAAFSEIDAEVGRPPIGFMINCAYPTFLNPASQPASVFQRLIGYQANGSSLDHTQLDGADQLQSDDLANWGDRMIDLNRRYGVKILGGCCGTGRAHLEYLTAHIDGKTVV